jgi:hypothetical protein
MAPRLLDNDYLLTSFAVAWHSIHLFRETKLPSLISVFDLLVTVICHVSISGELLNLTV